MKEKNTNKDIVAYHEAGHAVITRALNEPLYHIDVGDFKGKVIGGTAPEYFYDPDTMSKSDWIKIQKKALILLAGEEAERAFYEWYELDCDEFLSGYDRSRLSDLLMKFGESSCPPLDIDMSTKTLKKQASDLVAKHWNQIEVLAKELMIKGSMHGDEAKRIIESTEL